MKVFSVGIMLVLVLFVITTVIYIQRDRSFDAARDITKRNTPKNWNTHLKIGLIGDSWVAGEKLDQAIRDGLMGSGIEAEVVSSGHPGANSRQIYRDLFSDKSTPYSTKNFINDEDLDYLIVLAGVNDTASHMGRDFYAHHMLKIINAAQTRGIHPVIIEVPEYGIESYSPNGTVPYIKFKVYRALFDRMQGNVISAYREELEKQIPPFMLKDMTLVSFSTMVQDYSKSMSLYANNSHLNKEGCQRLGLVIAKGIEDTHKKRLRRMEKNFR